MTDAPRQLVRNALQGAFALIAGISPASHHAAVRLIPASSIAGRALVIVVAIMTFLATITTGCAILVRQSASQWGNQIAQEITIQIKPVSGRNIESDVNAASSIAKALAGVESVRAFSREDSSKMLEPWLGASISFDELPIPRLIAIKPAAQGLKPDALAQKLREASLPFVVDDHRLWRDRLTSMTNGLMLVALMILALVISAMVLVIAFATRGAMAGTRDIIDVMHFVGAHDRYISNEFQKHFFRLGLKGAITGGAGAIFFIVIAGHATRSWMSGPGAEQIESLFGAFLLGWSNLAFLGFISLAIALLVGRVSRFVVYRHLQMLR